MTLALFFAAVGFVVGFVVGWLTRNAATPPKLMIPFGPPQLHHIDPTAFSAWCNRRRGRPRKGDAPVFPIVPPRETRNATWVAKRLNVSCQTVCRLIAEGYLAAYKVREGGPWHVYIDSLDAYEQKLRTEMDRRATAGTKNGGPEDAA